YFVYRTQEGDRDVCEAVVDSVDEYVDAVADFLGERVEGRDKYYKYQSAEAFRESGQCRETATACSDSDEILTTKPVDGHELVHWVMSQRLTTDVPDIVAEGVANALSCEPHFDSPRADWDYRTFAVERPIS